MLKPLPFTSCHATNIFGHLCLRLYQPTNFTENKVLQFKQNIKLDSLNSCTSRNPYQTAMALYQLIHHGGLSAAHPPSTPTHCMYCVFREGASTPRPHIQTVINHTADGSFPSSSEKQKFPVSITVLPSVWGRTSFLATLQLRGRLGLPQLLMRHDAITSAIYGSTTLQPPLSTQTPEIILSTKLTHSGSFFFFLKKQKINSFFINNSKPMSLCSAR